MTADGTTEDSTAATPPDAARWSILVLSGVNLGMLGTRQPEIYGSDAIESHVERLRVVANGSGATVDHIASDSEAELVAAISRARTDKDAIVINPGAFTHYSWAIHDALAAFDGPIIEVHLSNPSGREPWRHTSVVTPVATAVIAGLGGLGYELAGRAVIALLS